VPIKTRIPLSAPDITEAEIDAVTTVLRRNQLSLGSELAAFESELAAYHSVADAVVVSSGTAGLHLALLALGVSAGHEVIVPSFAFVAVANTVLQVGATPIFADIEPVTLNLDPAAVEQAISSRTRAIVVVNTFGVPAAMDALRVIAQRYDLALIEDACEAIGAQFGDAPTAGCVGSFGDLAILGFYPNKQLTTGEGGAILSSSANLSARLRSLRNQGRQTNGDWLDHSEPGFNYRLSELACALGRVQLARLADILQLRNAAAQRYDNLLSEIHGLERPRFILPLRKISWFVYVVRMPIGLTAMLCVPLWLVAASRRAAISRPFIYSQPVARPTALSRFCPLQNQSRRGCWLFHSLIASLLLSSKRWRKSWVTQYSLCELIRKRAQEAPKDISGSVLSASSIRDCSAWNHVPDLTHQIAVGIGA
jgi:perosamine synthetase